MSGFPWSIAVTVVGVLMSFIGTLILLNLQSIKRCVSKLSTRIEKQDALIADVKETNDAIAVAMSNCKVDCHRNFVTGEAFLRETGFMRRTLENQTASINRIEGQMTLVDKLPEIVGNISRNIVREMKEG